MHEKEVDVKEIEQIIANTSEKTEQKIDWTSVWGKKISNINNLSGRS